MARPLLIASDHADFELKRKQTDALERRGIAFEDLGPETADSVDYPDYVRG